MSVSELFCELWLEAEQHSSAQREYHDTVWRIVRARLTAVLKGEDPSEIIAHLRAFLADKADNRLGAILAIMRAIDGAFDPIHPRSALFSASRTRPHIPGWLENAEASRQRNGYYFANFERVVVPRGPLTRWGDADEGASADTLQNRFKFLAVAKNHAEDKGRRVQVSIKVISQHGMRGVPPSAQTGEEIVHFAPLAEGEGDLSKEVVTIDGKRYLKVEPSAGMEPGKRLMQLSVQAGEVDLILAPELSMTSSAALELSDALRAEARPVPRMIVSGSALSTEKCEQDLSWNEASVLNRYGRPLWKQRKLVPYRMAAADTVSRGLLSEAEKVDLPEYAWSGDIVEVVDVDGFGRTVIFICEDFENVGLVESILVDFQPDWVLVPILDTGIKERRWSHLRSFGLSSIGQSRFMISSSLSMCYWREHGMPAPTDFPAVGIAIGPRDPAPGSADGARMFAKAELPSGATPRSARIQWGTADWQQTTVGVADR